MFKFTAVAAESGAVSDLPQLFTAALTGNTGGATPAELRAFFFFDLTSLPAGADIVSARLVFDEEVAQAGGNVFTELGGLIFDSVDMGGSLDDGDFDATVLVPAFATVTSRPVDARYDLEVGAALTATLTGGRTFFAARIRPVVPFDADGGAEQCVFAKEATAAVPVEAARLLVEVAP